MDVQDLGIGAAGCSAITAALMCGRRLHVIGHQNAVYCVAYCAATNSLFTASWDKSVKQFDAKNGKELKAFYGHTEWAVTCAVDETGATLYSGGYDSTIRQWDVVAGTHVVLGSHQGPVVRLQLSHDGLLLASASRDQSARLWNTVTREQIWVTNCSGPVTDIVLLPQLMMLCNMDKNPAGRDNHIQMWKLPLVELDTPGYAPNMALDISSHLRPSAVTTDETGSVIFVGFESGVIEAWRTDTATGVLSRRAFDESTLLKTLTGHDGSVTQLSLVNTRSDVLLISSSNDRSLRIWCAPKGDWRQAACRNVVSGHTGAVTRFALDDSRLFSCSVDQSIRVVDDVVDSSALKGFSSRRGMGSSLNSGWCANVAAACCCRRQRSTAANVVRITPASAVEDTVVCHPLKSREVVASSPAALLTILFALAIMGTEYMQMCNFVLAASTGPDSSVMKDMRTRWFAVISHSLAISLPESGRVISYWVSVAGMVALMTLVVACYKGLYAFLFTRSGSSEVWNNVRKAVEFTFYAFSVLGVVSVAGCMAAVFYCRNNQFSPDITCWEGSHWAYVFIGPLLFIPVFIFNMRLIGVKGRLLHFGFHLVSWQDDNTAAVMTNIHPLAMRSAAYLRGFLAFKVSLAVLAGLLFSFPKAMAICHFCLLVCLFGYSLHFHPYYRHRAQVLHWTLQLSVVVLSLSVVLSAFDVIDAPWVIPSLVMIPVLFSIAFLGVLVAERCCGLR